MSNNYQPPTKDQVAAAIASVRARGRPSGAQTKNDPTSASAASGATTATDDGTSTLFQQSASKLQSLSFGSDITDSTAGMTLRTINTGNIKLTSSTTNAGLVSAKRGIISPSTAQIRARRMMREVHNKPSPNCPKSRTISEYDSDNSTDLSSSVACVDPKTVAQVSNFIDSLQKKKGSPVARRLAVSKVNTSLPPISTAVRNSLTSPSGLRYPSLNSARNVMAASPTGNKLRVVTSPEEMDDFNFHHVAKTPVNEPTPRRGNFTRNSTPMGASPSVAKTTTPSDTSIRNSVLSPNTTRSGRASQKGGTISAREAGAPSTLSPNSSEDSDSFDNSSEDSDDSSSIGDVADSTRKGVDQFIDSLNNKKGGTQDQAKAVMDELNAKCSKDVAQAPSGNQKTTDSAKRKEKSAKGVSPETEEELDHFIASVSTKEEGLGSNPDSTPREAHTPVLFDDEVDFDLINTVSQVSASLLPPLTVNTVSLLTTDAVGSVSRQDDDGGTMNAAKPVKESEPAPAPSARVARETELESSKDKCPPTPSSSHVTKNESPEESMAYISAQIQEVVRSENPSMTLGKILAEANKRGLTLDVVTDIYKKERFKASTDKIANWESITSNKAETPSEVKVSDAEAENNNPPEAAAVSGDVADNVQELARHENVNKIAVSKVESTPAMNSTETPTEAVNEDGQMMSNAKVRIKLAVQSSKPSEAFGEILADATRQGLPIDPLVELYTKERRTLSSSVSKKVVDEADSRLNVGGGDPFAIPGLSDAQLSQLKHLVQKGEELLDSLDEGDLMFSDVKYEKNERLEDIDAFFSRFSIQTEQQGQSSKSAKVDSPTRKSKTAPREKNNPPEYDIIGEVLPSCYEQTEAYDRNIDNNDSSLYSERGQVAEFRTLENGDGAVLFMQESSLEVEFVASAVKKPKEKERKKRREERKDKPRDNRKVVRCDVPGHLGLWRSPWKRNRMRAQVDSSEGCKRDAINGVSAAAVFVQRSRSSVQRQCSLTAEERTKGHNGFGDVDFYSLYDATTIKAEDQEIDAAPWEFRDVRQRFLHEKSVESRNWFGTFEKKRGNDRVHAPVSRPKSLEVSVTRIPDPEEWSEDWFTTWKSRRDNPNNLVTFAEQEDVLNADLHNDNTVSVSGSHSTDGPEEKSCS
ncbi:predicted protein [Thalassiosira pseudonana CCMP1335]|uniref:Uncharacterized protein n=1 Tax=Thalassiosira pseudonana TaxID=35128 RepID=B8C2M7_THAPS|nr:predicted protein [Thalassiosira pseudonana CCMP1335]EED91974.1 predicted protein [Thalassiosira pseudonana CCMP1335]